MKFETSKPKDHRKVVFTECQSAVERAAKTLSFGENRLGWRKHTLVVDWRPRSAAFPQSDSEGSTYEALIYDECFALRDQVLPRTRETTEWFKTAQSLEVAREMMSGEAEVKKGLMLWERFALKFRHVNGRVIKLDYGHEHSEIFRGSTTCDLDSFLSELSVELARLEHIERSFKRLKARVYVAMTTLVVVTLAYIAIRA